MIAHSLLFSMAHFDSIAPQAPSATIYSTLSSTVIDPDCSYYRIGQRPATSLLTLPMDYVPNATGVKAFALPAINLGQVRLFYLFHSGTRCKVSPQIATKTAAIGTDSDPPKAN
jgi:hypothetical protein